MVRCRWLRLSLYGVLALGPLTAYSDSSCPALDYCDSARGFTREAEEITGRQGPADFRCETVSGKRYQELASLEGKRGVSAAELQYEGTLFEILGIIPAGYDYQRCVLDGAANASAAFYAPRSKTIYFRNDAALPRSLAIHELTHVIQDHVFNLASFEPLEATTDSKLAGAALREGDAMLAETIASRGEPVVINPECGPLVEPAFVSGCEPPPVLAKIFTFPYEWGLRYANLVKEQGGGAALNGLFRSPPRTTTEVLYPNRFNPAKLRGLERGADRIRSQNSLVGEVYTDTLGEFVLRELLKEYAGLALAGKAAKGWLGDRVSLIRGGDDRWRVAWRIAVETEQDLEELKLAVSGYVLKRFGISVNAKAARWEAKRAPIELRLKSDLQARSAELSITIAAGSAMELEEGTRS